MPLVYDELRQLAGAFMSRESADHTLQPTALVHEAFLRICDRTGIHWKNPGHLRAVGARAMRRILVDHARARNAEKRGGGRRPVTLAGELVEAGGAAPSVLELDDVLAKLAARSERQARIVELRFFGGMTILEVAETLGLSETTIEDEWRFARAWLNRELVR